MATMLLDSPKRRRTSSSESTGTMLSIAAFAIVVLICLAMLSPIVWTAVQTFSSRESPSTVAQCSTLNDDSWRLACYDKVVGRSLPQPAKGANAPLFIHPSR